MDGSCSRDGDSVKTASIGGDTFQGLVVMHVSSPEKNIIISAIKQSSTTCGSNNST
jgi:hypothetical protein